jgi:hypothetical protein
MILYKDTALFAFKRDNNPTRLYLLNIRTEKNLFLLCHQQEVQNRCW